jgi:predicted 2-oxoglutarate/Fe(II)-dependent dioxygenase YbiX/peroxiredoxin
MNAQTSVERRVPAPWVLGAAPNKPTSDFSSLAGHFVVLVFFGHSDLSDMRQKLATLGKQLRRWPDDRCVIFGVTSKRADWQDAIVGQAFPRARVFLDEKWDVARAYGLLTPSDQDNSFRFKASWFVLDPTLRVYARGEMNNIERLIDEVARLPHPSQHATPTTEAWAPVLMVPRVLTPTFCRALIDYYNAGDAQESGFMRARDGKTVGMTDPSFKRRKDVQIADERLRQGLRQSLATRLVPQLKNAFQYEATRIERYIVACYDSESQGFFKPHRDNTTSGTAHRRFAVTINLNAEEFEGGELRFPEFGSRTYKAPTGGAIVFSCSVLHEAMPVTAGTRYATLPFLYGEADVDTRHLNRESIVHHTRAE